MTKIDYSALLAAATPGPWSVDDHAIGVWAPNAKICSETKIFDVRGWGYLTGHGHGALGLTHSEAIDRQRANANLASLAPQMAQRIIDLEAALEGLVSLYDTDEGSRSLPQYVAVRALLKDEASSEKEVTA